MAILRVKDEQGNIIEIPAIKGEKGDKGDNASATDVQINGTSITQDGVANIPIAAQGTFGLVKTNAKWYSGLEFDKDNTLKLISLGEEHINNRYIHTSGVIHGKNLDYAVKAAMCDGKGAAWTNEEKANARARIGIDREPIVIDIETTEEARSISIESYNDKPLSDYDFKQLWVMVENVGNGSAQSGASSELQVKINSNPNIYISAPTGFINYTTKQYWAGNFDLISGNALASANALSMPTWRTNAFISIANWELASMKNITNIFVYSVLTDIPVGTKFKFVLR